MPIRNPNFYNLQSTRRYPLDDRATGTDDAGGRIKDDILVDCHLRWPSTYGQYAYLGGITVTPRLVTVTILAANSIDDPGDFTPLASVTLPQPVNEHVHYPVTALSPGVGGFLVFSDVSEPFVGRYATPRQSLLAPKVARAYAPLPIPTLRKLGRVDGLEGVVRLLAGTDLEIVKETHEILGLEREALVIRLVQLNASRNVLQVYRGECDNRPESRTCNKEGIESINDVSPDCDGNLNILFVGMTDAQVLDPRDDPEVTCAQNSLAAGVVLDQHVGISQVCQALHPGRFTGHDYCAPSSLSSLSSEALPEEPSEEDVPEDPEEPGSEPCGQELPVRYTFDAFSAADFETLTGNFVFESIDSPDEPGGDATPVSYVAYDTSRRNAALLENCAAVPTVGVRVFTSLSFVDDGSRHNGNLILNYHLVDETSNPRVEYFVVSLDKNLGKVRLLRWGGTAFIEEYAAVVGAPLLVEDWYRLSVDIVQVDASNVALDVTVSGISDEDWPTISFSVMSHRYLPADGQFGIGSDRSRCRFSYLQIEAL